MAGVVAAIITPDVVGSRPNVRCSYPPSEKVVEAVEELEETRQYLEELQMSIDPDPERSRVELDLRLVGLVEAWVAGATWDQIPTDTSLDPGDIARLLSRVVDVLRQAVHCQSLEKGIRDAARLGVKQMVRQPISELF